MKPEKRTPLIPFLCKREARARSLAPKNESDRNRKVSEKELREAMIDEGFFEQSFWKADRKRRKTRKIQFPFVKGEGNLYNCLDPAKS